MHSVGAGLVSARCRTALFTGGHEARPYMVRMVLYTLIVPYKI